MSEFPRAEQLPLGERIINLGKDVIRVLMHGSAAMAGMPDSYQDVQLGLIEAERYANQPHD